MTQLRGMHAELKTTLEGYSTLDQTKVNTKKLSRLGNYVRILEDCLSSSTLVETKVPLLEKELKSLFSNHPELTHVYGVYHFYGRDTKKKCPAFLDLNPFLPNLVL